MDRECRSPTREVACRPPLSHGQAAGWGSVCLLFLSFAATGLAQGFDRPASEVVREILITGWRSSPAANREIDRLYRVATEAASGTELDWRIEYAYALAKMRQWRYREVVPIAERLALQPEAEMAGRELLVWLHTVLKDYPAAMVQMERLAATLPKMEDDLGEAERLHRELLREEKARFLGVVFGYLSGPVAASLSDFERESRRRRIVRLLSEAEVEMFDEETFRVIDDFHVRSDERAELVDQELREQERKRAERLGEIEEFRRGISERLEALDEAEQRARQEHNEKSEQLRAEDTPLREQLANVDTELVGLTRNLTLLNVEILRIEDQLALELDPVIRAALLVELNRLSALAASYNRDFTRLDVSAARLRTQRQGLATQLRQSEARYRGVLNQSRVQQEQMNKELRRLEGEERRLMRERPRTSGQARALQTSKQAFSTYLPFPAEEARARLLESL
jgi:hypothetical protein